jgi:hypothetical protein
MARLVPIMAPQLGLMVLVQMYWTYQILMTVLRKLAPSVFQLPLLRLYGNPTLLLSVEYPCPETLRGKMEICTKVRVIWHNLLTCVKDTIPTKRKTILMTEFQHKDMVEIARRVGYEVYHVSSRDSMEPDLNDFVHMMNTVNPDIVLVTHAFFKIPNHTLDVIRDIVRGKEGVLLVEDCAQIPMYAYGPLSHHTDVYMFSLGKLKQLCTGSVTAIGVFHGESIHRLFVDQYSVQPKRGFLRECYEIVTHQIHTFFYNEMYWLLALVRYDEIVLYKKFKRSIELSKYIDTHNIVPGWLSTKIARVMAYNLVKPSYSVSDKIATYNNIYNQNIPCVGNYMYPIINLPRKLENNTSHSQDFTLRQTSIICMDTKRRPESIRFKSVY